MSRAKQFIESITSEASDITPFLKVGNRVRWAERGDMISGDISKVLKDSVHCETTNKDNRPVNVHISRIMEVLEPNADGRSMDLVWNWRS